MYLLRIFILGSSATYDPSSLVQHGDIVTVTFNYRVGVPDFLYLGDLLGEDYARSGNNGLLDMLLVLRWVHENIAIFGGDPAQVTLMGESAAAMSVGTLLTVPTAQPRKIPTWPIPIAQGSPPTLAPTVTRSMRTTNVLVSAGRLMRPGSAR